MSYVFERKPPWEIMPYPKLRFLLLKLLGAHAFVAEAKRQIDAINHLRKKEWLKSAPRRTRGFVSMKWPDKKFDSSDIYIFPKNKKALENIYSNSVPEYTGSHTHTIRKEL